jgi:uncharacterized protein (TIGR02391 family)
MPDSTKIDGMSPARVINEQTLQAICDVLGDTQSGLTGGEIGRLLKACQVEDSDPGATKRHRLFAALSSKQRLDGSGDAVLAFTTAAMNPVRYVQSASLFEKRRSGLNSVLGFSSLALGEDGVLRGSDPVRTISEAQERAGRLRRELLNRRVHGDVLTFCEAELLQDDYFHAVFEATKSVADKIRTLTGLKADGSALVDAAFGLGKTSTPRLAFNSLKNQTERSEHIGLVNLLKGLFGTFRNTTAHAPRIKWHISEDDALDMLSLASLLHRRLDSASRLKRD